MPSASEERRARLLEAPDLFLVTYFPHKLKALKPFHLRLIELATTARRSLVLFPAAHGKTTLISTLLPIWAVCRDPNVRIAIITKNDKDAGDIMSAIIAELVQNEDLIRDFGPFVAEDKAVPFGRKALSVAARTARFKEPNIAAFGSGSRSALGHRSDWTICDDIVTDKNSSTPEQREKLKQWFNQGPQTMMDEIGTGRLTIVGTSFDPNDLYADLTELRNPDSGDPIYEIERVSALVDVCTCGHDEDRHDPACDACRCPDFLPDPTRQRVLWPERRPWIWLMEQKASMGTLDFNKRYRNIAVDASRMVFREQYVMGGYIGRDHHPGCLDRQYRVGEYDESWRRAGGFDPAIGITKSRKFCAHIALAAGACDQHERCLWVIDLDRDQLTQPQQVDSIITMHERYQLQTTWIEANSYQAGLYQAVKQKLDERGLAMRMEPHYTSRVNKPDPEIGVGAMSVMFENGKVHIPWGDRVSQRKMQQLVDELIMYPGRYTDTVMAFWFAWRALERSAPRFQTSTYLRKPVLGALNRGRWTVQNPAYARRG